MFEEKYQEEQWDYNTDDNSNLANVTQEDTVLSNHDNEKSYNVDTIPKLSDDSMHFMVY